MRMSARNKRPEENKVDSATMAALTVEGDCVRGKGKIELYLCACRPVISAPKRTRIQQD